MKLWLNVTGRLVRNDVSVTDSYLCCSLKSRTLIFLYFYLGLLPASWDSPRPRRIQCLTHRQIAERSVCICAAAIFAKIQGNSEKKIIFQECLPAVLAQPPEKYPSLLTFVYTFVQNSPHRFKQACIWVFPPFLLRSHSSSKYKPSISPKLVTLPSPTCTNITVTQTGADTQQSGQLCATNLSATLTGTSRGKSQLVPQP